MEKYIQVRGRSMSGNLELPKNFHKKKWLSCPKCGCKLFKAYYQEGVLTIICSKCTLEVTSE